MPMISVQYATPRPGPGLPKKIAKAARQLSSEILRKDPDVTAVVVEEIEPANWFCKRRGLSVSIAKSANRTCAHVKERARTAGAKLLDSACAAPNVVPVSPNGRPCQSPAQPN
jgi:phenylpyruvate tautomerase PptA (4-oxalocrotonate tautomerase family)